ncbi:hypothetical protein BASA50_009159 [Batrachochytrium salamandrivorans]|uniref:Uncharacterized protein n=1 Tax=Batrachochytrium salamandrivorans TaxID=1357716 RepID=A0ABQ8F243_9FUNG|nr:hypothetical protein BASA50_009159 [Batrachochytrium salamandrivorans]
MQFFHLFSFVVVASYAAALPQLAGLSNKYLNSVDTNLASGLEARSYQPGSNSQKNPATLTLLKRQDDSERLSGENSGSDSSPLPETTHEPIEVNNSILLGKSLFGAMLLSSVASGFGASLGDVPENAAAAGASVGGSTGNSLIEYLKDALYATDYLEYWIGDSGANFFAVIKSGLGDKEYAEVEPSLKKTGEKVAADASDNLKKVTDALLAIERQSALAKPKLDVIQAALERVLESYRVYFDMLLTQLEKFASGQVFNKYLSAGVSSIAKFIQSQKEVYDSIRKELNDAPSE